MPCCLWPARLTINNYKQYVVARKVSGNPDGLIGWMRRWLDLADLYGMWQWPEDAQR